MTLADLAMPISYDDAKHYALVFDAGLALRLSHLQAEFGNPRHVPNPVRLTDGRWMLCGDILTECVPSGIVWQAYRLIRPEVLAEIEVVPMSDAVALLPPDPPMPV
jgi:hypothetical protein